MNLENISISEKTFLVTGAGTGIGYAIADRLIADGAKVILHCNSHLEAARELASQAKTDCIVVQKDLSVSQAGEELVTEAIAKGYSIDGIVNNAAMMSELSSDDHPSVWEEKWLKTLQVN